MRYQYVVLLKRNSDRSIDWISVFLCLFSGFNFLFEQIQARRFNFFLGIVAIFVLTGALFSWFSAVLTRRRPTGDHRPRSRYKYWLLAAGLGWLGMPYLQWLSVSLFLLTFLEYQAKYPLEIAFSPDKIVINSLFRKTFAWSAFTNILLKDGLLTIDFKNNRLLQKEVDEEEEGDADEDEFNEYCRERLRAVQES